MVEKCLYSVGYIDRNIYGYFVRYFLKLEINYMFINRKDRYIIEQLYSDKFYNKKNGQLRVVSSDVDIFSVD